MSLTSCLRKFGKNISPQDRQAIMELAAAFRAESGGKGADANNQAAIRAVREHMATIDAEIEALKKPAPAARPAEAKAQEAGQPSPEQQIGRVADAVIAEQPDLQVMMEGMDQPMSAAQLIEQIKAEAAADVADAPLLRVAAECALRAGT